MAKRMPANGGHQTSASFPGFAKNVAPQTTKTAYTLRPQALDTLYYTVLYHTTLYYTLQVFLVVCATGILKAGECAVVFKFRGCLDLTKTTVTHPMSIPHGSPMTDNKRHIIYCTVHFAHTMFDSILSTPKKANTRRATVTSSLVHLGSSSQGVRSSLWEKTAHNTYPT